MNTPNRRSMRAVIMAGGDGSRWGNYLGTTKHLLTIEGERLVERTVRQLVERGVDDIIVLGTPDVLEAFAAGATPAVAVAPRYVGLDIDKFRSTVEHWLVNDDPERVTFVLYGDVWFSDAGLDRLLDVDELGDVRPFDFVGRFGPSELTGTPYGELFGLRLTRYGYGLVDEAIGHVRALLAQDALPRGGGWELYRAATGARLVAELLEHVDRGAFVEVDDFTDDFDYPADLTRWLKARARGAART